MFRSHAPRLGLFTLLAPAAWGAVQHHEFAGDSSNDSFGISVASVADFDSDGIRDLAVGAHLDDPGGTNSGSVSLYSGATGLPVHFLPGGAAGEQFGYSVADAGDVDGDGHGDVVIGAWLSNAGGTESGRVLVHSGFDGSVLHTFVGLAPGDHFGHSVAGGVDIDNDGRDDLIVGAPLSDVGGVDSGEVHLFSGRNGSLLLKLPGSSTADHFGFSVSGVSDVNGDGFDDVIVGAPLDDDNGSESGRASVFSGSDGSVLSIVDGDSPGDELGIAVGRAEDVDGDGQEDWIVSAWHNDSGGNNAGRVRVLSGAVGTVIRTIDGSAAGIGLGRGGVCGLGDVDFDGKGDLLVGSPFADIEGGNSGLTSVFSGQNGAELHSFVWNETGDLTGYSVANAGDVNGDGVADVLVGAPSADEGSNGSGGAYVYLAGCWAKNFCTSTVNSSGDRGRLRMRGSNSVTANRMSLEARSVPRNQFGIVFYGANQIQVPMGQGFLCAGGGGLGLFRMNPVVQISPDGVALFDADFTRPPSNSGAGSIIAGSVWNFQFWFRDPPAGHPTTNLTDGVEVEFCP